MRCTKAEREFLDQLYTDEPGLKKEGLDHFSGWYVHWNEIIARFKDDPDTNGYSESPTELIVQVQDARDDLRKERDTLKQWVNDLQSGMFINCVYCGHRYGPKEATPTTMADILKEHISKCPKHPLAKLRKAVGDTISLLMDGEYPSSLARSQGAALLQDGMKP